MNDQAERDKEAAHMTEIIEAWRVKKPIEEFVGGKWCDFNSDTKRPDFIGNPYRVKPKPIEMWAVVLEGKVIAFYDNRETATSVARNACSNTTKVYRTVRLTESKGD